MYMGSVNNKLCEQKDVQPVVQTLEILNKLGIFVYRSVKKFGSWYTNCQAEHVNLSSHKTKLIQ